MNARGFFVRAPEGALRLSACASEGALRPLAAALCVGLSLTGCAADSAELTQLVVTVDSDLSVPGELDRVSIELLGARADAASADLTKQGLPRSLGLLHTAGPLGPITVRAVGWRGSERVVERSLQASFERGQTARIELVLEAACSGVMCASGETCSGGSCPAIAADAGVGDAGADASTETVCSIALPAVGDSYQVGTRFELSGSCTDRAGAAIGTGLSWRSDRDGALASSANASTMLSTLGVHNITLCAGEPASRTAQGCAAVDVEAVALAEPSAAITRITQGQTMRDPFSTGAAITCEGTGTGAGVTLSWSDNLQGSFGSGAMATLTAPQVGKHLITLTAVDRDGKSATTSASFSVLPPGRSSLVQAFTQANARLGAVSTLVEGPSGVAYAASAGSGLYRVDATNPASSATLVLGEPQLVGVVREALKAPTAGFIYFATQQGLTTCGYVASSGINTSCRSYAGNDFPSDDLFSVLRVAGNGNNERLLIGTGDGLFSTDNAAGSDVGTVRLAGRTIRALQSDGTASWVATDQGLYRYAANTGMANPANAEGAPSSSLTALATGANGVLWVGSSNGLARYTPATDSWRVWRSAEGLANNQVSSLAVSRETIAGTARDVVWVGTQGGVSRFDAQLETFVTLTMADGLPSEKVSDVLIMSDGSKLFATDAGIARYAGL